MIVYVLSIKTNLKILRMKHMIQDSSRVILGGLLTIF